MIPEIILLVVTSWYKLRHELSIESYAKTLSIIKIPTLVITKKNIKFYVFDIDISIKSYKL